MILIATQIMIPLLSFKMTLHVSENYLHFLTYGCGTNHVYQNRGFARYSYCNLTVLPFKTLIKIMILIVVTNRNAHLHVSESELLSVGCENYNHKVSHH